MMMLYQFPISPYCEKARWALEYKELDYRIKNLVPGPHFRTLRKIAPGTILPLLIDGDEVVQGSDSIITYLDKKQSHPALTPTTTEDASMAHEWERYADTNVGVPLRLFFYFHLLQNRKLATKVLTEDGPWWSGPLYKILFPVVRKGMRAAMGIDAEGAKAAQDKLLAAFEYHRQATRKTQVSGRTTIQPCRPLGQRVAGSDLAVPISPFLKRSMPSSAHTPSGPCSPGRVPFTTTIEILRRSCINYRFVMERL